MKPEVKNHRAASRFFVVLALALAVIAGANCVTNAQTPTPTPLWVPAGTSDITNNNAGNVGIGTSAPTSKLDVVGTASVSGDLKAAGGRVKFSFSGPEGYMQGATERLSFWTTNGSGGQAMRLRLNGNSAYSVAEFANVNVTIGGTVPAAHALTSYSGLWLKNNVAVMSEVANGYSIIKLGANLQRNGAAWSNVDPALPTWVLDMGAGPGWDQFAVSRSPSGSYNQNTFFMVSNSGNVGMGTNTPTYKLQVSGGGGIPGDSLLVTDSNSLATGLDIANTSAGAKKWRLQSVGSGITGRVGNFELVETGANLRALVVQPGGNVGIGTMTPGYKLDVQGGMLNASDGLCIAGICKSTWSGIGSSQWSGTSDIFFNSGNVGIGTTTPVVPLHIRKDQAAATKLIVQNVNGSGQETVGFSGSTAQWNLGQTNGDGNFRISNDPNGSLTLGTVLTATNAGFVGIGTSAPATKLHVAGDLTVDGNLNAKYQDVAEWVPSTSKLSPGTVVVLDPNESNQVTPSFAAYDTRVAGVVSAQPGLTLGVKGDNKSLVATTGRVKVKVDARSGPIRIGDLLVTSDVSGLAMKSVEVELGGVKIHRPGTIIGKALEPLASGTGEILVLLSLQ